MLYQTMVSMPFVTSMLTMWELYVISDRPPSR
jgi:hypothetical protein